MMENVKDRIECIGLKWNEKKCAHKIISGSGGNHPKGSIAALYLTRNNGGRGLKSVEEEYITRTSR